MTITFDRLPCNLEELQAMPYATLNQPEYGAALFLAVMMHYTVETERGFDQEIDGRMKIFISSSGADSKRHVMLRHKVSTDQWFVEDQMLLAMIRTPKSQDPWA